MQKWMHFAACLLFASSTLLFTACGDDDDVPTAEDGLIEFLNDSPELSTFRDALDEADLIDNIRLRTNNVTVFAPTNQAFQTFLQANNYATLEDVPDDVLQMVLRGHIIDDEFSASELQTGYYASINDESFDQDDAFTSIYVENTANDVVINGEVNVTTADQMTEDGIIHTVDQVIELPTVVTFASVDENFSMLVEALTRDDLNTDFLTTLGDEGPYTIFAPTNEAFEALLTEEGWATVDDIPAATLESVLRYHVIAGQNLRGADLDDGDAETTLNGQTLTFDFTGTTPQVIGARGPANIVVSDVQGTNGVIHAISTVLQPGE